MNGRLKLAAAAVALWIALLLALTIRHGWEIPVSQPQVALAPLVVQATMKRRDDDVVATVTRVFAGEAAVGAELVVRVKGDRRAELLQGGEKILPLERADTRRFRLFAWPGTDKAPGERVYPATALVVRQVEAIVAGRAAHK